VSATASSPWTHGPHCPALSAVTQEPPETGAPEPDGACEGVGASAGCWGPPPPSVADDEDGDALLDAGRVERALTVRPWNDFAATRENRPERATAPAIVQRLIREISASPLSRVVTRSGGSGALLTALDVRHGPEELAK
jgi:hypothetical protein